MKAQIARCKHCNSPVLISVIPVTKEGAKDFAELLMDGHPVNTEDWSVEQEFNFCDTFCTKQEDNEWSAK